MKIKREYRELAVKLGCKMDDSPEWIIRVLRDEIHAGKLTMVTAAQETDILNRHKKMYGGY